MPHQLVESSLPSSLQLPEEVLSDIFMDIVFEHTHNGSWSLSMSFVGQEVRIIHHRLYCLLKVCRAWRDVMLARGAFWSVIPMVTDPSEFAGRQQPFQLSLQRAGGSKLHLAIAKLFSVSPVFFNLLKEYGPRFSTINIMTDSTRLVRKTIGALLKPGTLGTLPELSFQITNESESYSHHGVPSYSANIIPHKHPLSASFATLLESLSTFRLCGAKLCWDTTRFSSRLVELHIGDVALGYDEEIVLFLQAISSASGLLYLEIVSVVTFRDPDTTPDTNVSSFVTFPKLRSLFLAGLYFNTLETLLPMIASSTHRLSLVLGHRSFMIHKHGGFNDGETRTYNILIDDSKLFNLLEHTPVDALTVFGNQWWIKHAFCNLLKIMPTLKTLNVDNCTLNWDNCSQLERPLDALMQPQDFPFAALDNLRITRSSIYVEAFEEFKKMVTSHPLKQVVLGVTISQVGLTGERNWEPLQEDSDLLGWLRVNVPVVRVVDHGFGSPEDYRPRRRW